MSKIKSYQELKSKKKPVLQRVVIALDGDRADEFNAKRTAMELADEAHRNEPKSTKLKNEFLSAKEAYDALLADVEDYTVEFVFRSIGRPAFEELVDSCQPTNKQIQEARKKDEEEPVWNPDTFMPGLIAKAIVEPELTEEDVFDLWESPEWNQAELLSLFFAALQVNQSRKVVDLGKESGQTLALGQN